MAERLYFICEFKLDDKSHFVVWYTCQIDGLILNSRGSLETFTTSGQAYEYAERNGIKIHSEEIDNFDFDNIKAWCRQPYANRIYCSEYLDVWNMLHDVILTVGKPSKFRVVDVKLNAIYDKLFAGSNVLRHAETEPYVPTWSFREIRALRRLFSIGLRELRCAISA